MQRENAHSPLSLSATCQQGGQGLSLWMAATEPEEDVWEILHQMMDEPAPMTSMLMPTQVSAHTCANVHVLAHRLSNVM